MSDSAADKYLDVHKPDSDFGVITRDEFEAWQESKRKSIQREANYLMADEDGALDFLIDAGWKWKKNVKSQDRIDYLDSIVPDDVGLVPPYYTLVGYKTLREAVVMELTAQEYWRFKQNIMEEKAKHGQTRNCIIDRG